MNPESISRIRGGLRHLLTFAGGWLVAEGRLSLEEWSTISGALIAAAGGFWSWHAKRRVPPPEPIRLTDPVPESMPGKPIKAPVLAPDRSTSP